MAVARQQQDSPGDQGVQNVTALSLTSCQSRRLLLSFPPRRELPKTLTGIRGFDEITRGLFVRLGYAIRTVGAKRVVLDTIESLFSGLKDTGILRSELRRLFSWLKEQGLDLVTVPISRK